MSTIHDTLNDIIEQNDYVDISESEKYNFIKTMYDERNIEMKTEINNVVASCSLVTLIKYAEINGLVKTAQTLREFDENYLKRMLSNKRESRKEAFNSVNTMNFIEESNENNEKINKMEGKLRR